MREVGRNDPCPCGSGRKHKRCCLDADRTALRWPTGSSAGSTSLATTCAGSIDPRGNASSSATSAPFGLHFEDADWLDIWLVCHAPVLDGRTPLEACEHSDPADAQLAQSAICPSRSASASTWASGACQVV